MTVLICNQIYVIEFLYTKEYERERERELRLPYGCGNCKISTAVTECENEVWKDNRPIIILFSHKCLYLFYD